MSDIITEVDLTHLVKPFTEDLLKDNLFCIEGLPMLARNYQQLERIVRHEVENKIAFIILSVPEFNQVVYTHLEKIQSPYVAVYVYLDNFTVNDIRSSKLSINAFQTLEEARYHATLVFNNPELIMHLLV